MFEASRPFLFFDYFRIPYAVLVHGPGPTEVAGGRPGLAWLRVAHGAGEGRTLHWPSFADWPAARRPRVGAYSIDSQPRTRAEAPESQPLFSRLAPEERFAEWAPPGRWEPWLLIRDRAGRPAGSIRREANGAILLPFDPSEAILNFWFERYQTTRPRRLLSAVRRGGVRGYYRVRPLLPRPAQIAFRRLVSRVQARSTFPRWPLETALHDLYGLLFRIAAELAGSAIPWIAPWPTPYRWALVLTHDVETETGYRNLPAVRDLERQLGYRSAWNFVARRYRVADERVAELTADGFEVGVHGLYHDGRDLESLATLMRRLPEMRACAERWGATGFRSPATQRDWRLVSALGFDYDSSYPDTDPFEPQPGGCCSWLPYPIGRVVELPITLPQDHTLFAILRTVDAEPWIAKASVLRERGGMALLITHPDYLVGARELGVYRAFLAHFAADDRAWRALPREVAAWWRRRAASEIRRVDGSWRVVGPAAGDAEVCFGPPA